MNIENSTNVLLSKDINRIREGHDISKNSVLYSGILHLKNKDIEIRDLITTDITRDFNNAIADSIQVQFYMPSGDYQVDVVPELDTLEFTIVKSYGVNVELIERFKFIVLNNTSAKMGSVTENQKKEELNKQSMQVVIGQAVNILYYATRLITITKALRGVTLQEAISFSFNDFINNPRDIKINGTPIKLDKLNIDPPNNPNKLNNLILPSHVTVYDMPTELQDKYGVYNGHIGTYITRDYKDGAYINSVWVYPLYNPIMVKNRKRKMRLYASIGFTSRMVDRTFLDSENNLDILVSAEESNNQIFGQYSASNGTGVSVLDSNEVTKANPLENGKSKNKSKELSTREGFDKADGVSFNLSGGQTSNAYKHRTNVLKQKGTTLTVNWNFSMPELVYPGMTVEYIYEKFDKDGNSEIKILNGIVQAISSRADVNKKTCHSNIFIFLDPTEN